MSGMERASAQSQSRRPFFVGSLGFVYISYEEVDKKQKRSRDDVTS